jgi:hypothetical protein
MEFTGTAAAAFFEKQKGKSETKDKYSQTNGHLHLERCTLNTTEKPLA